MTTTKPDDSVSTLRTQLQQIEALHRTGVLQDAAYNESKATLERRLLDVIMQGAPDVPTPAVSSPKTSASLGLKAGLAVAVVAVAVLGYAWKGTPSQLLSAAPPAAAPAQGTPEGPHATNFDQIAAMTEKLAERLKSQPQDAEGWAMLARSYSVLSRHDEALKAYEKAVSLRKDDANLLADYADSLAIQNGRSLAGAPMKQVEKALKLDPVNLKALSLAGTYAFDRKDYAGAVKYWEKVVQTGPADNSIVGQIEPALAEARSLAGLPAQEKSKPAAPSAVDVRGTVTLASALQKQVNPDDTVFVFARPASGSRMPLAILRKQVRDLPLTFVLDDSMAMSPAAKLSTATDIVVGARISKSGNAMPQPGDLTGQSATVRPGASALAIEIREVVKP